MSRVEENCSSIAAIRSPGPQPIITLPFPPPPAPPHVEELGNRHELDGAIPRRACHFPASPFRAPAARYTKGPPVQQLGQIASPHRSLHVRQRWPESRKSLMPRESLHPTDQERGLQGG